MEELRRELEDQTALQESAILALSRIDDEQARAKIKELNQAEFIAAEEAIEEIEREQMKRR